MTVILKNSGQTATLIDTKGAFAIIKIAGQKGTTIINRDFIKWS